MNMVMMVRRWRWQIPMYILRPAWHWITSTMLAFLRRVGDTELDTIEEDLRLTRRHRDELHHGMEMIHQAVSEGEEFNSWQRTLHRIERLKATRWN